MIRVSPRSHSYEDRAGDPLDGLVNMFDVGIVLAVGFLLAALASLNLTGTLTTQGLTRPADHAITVPPGSVSRTLPPSLQPTAGRGTVVGQVYRLDDGRLIYVVPRSALPSAPAPPSPAPSPTR